MAGRSGELVFQSVWHPGYEEPSGAAPRTIRSGKPDAEWLRPKAGDSVGSGFGRNRCRLSGIGEMHRHTALPGTGRLVRYSGTLLRPNGRGIAFSGEAG